MINDIFEKAIVIRKHLNRVLHKRMNNLKKSFNNLIDNEEVFDKNNFSKLKDSIYYLGGYPSDKSLGKIESHAKYLSMISYYLIQLDNKEFLYKILNECGIKEITFTDEFIDTNKNIINQNNKEKLKEILNDAVILQSEICQTADQIKIDLFEELPKDIKYDKNDNKIGIKSSKFNKLVSNKITKFIKNKRTKLLNNIDVQNQSLSLESSVIIDTFVEDNNDDD